MAFAVEPAFPDESSAAATSSRSSTVVARVRDGLVLRAVPKNKSAVKHHSDERRAR